MQCNKSQTATVSTLHVDAGATTMPQQLCVNVIAFLGAYTALML